MYDGSHFILSYCPFDPGAATVTCRFRGGGGWIFEVCNACKRCYTIATCPNLINGVVHQTPMAPDAPSPQ
ncbi:hypothetical protein COLO4_15459 [Corchorus olitorius]|uniref:Uncharacterized protein n=1 Tax=Corchorus olitorius TaxID=93759 RepID=A0A1R3JN71_9ROSI|nr:hypothetical protein COLO4_15459 [Corchorus olitorius]